MSERNTDVHGSIAGYYYQVLLACKEITDHTSGVVKVGIESGADVRVFTKDDNTKSIEAKFYKTSMSKYHKDICKTVYNFYLNSFNDIKLEFKTNTKPTSVCKDFFRKWNNGNSDESQIEFIKTCILKQSFLSCDCSKEKLETYLKTAVGAEKSKDALIRKIIGSNSEYKFAEYSNFNKNVNLKAFSSKLSFIFDSKDKYDSISELRSIIANNIGVFAQREGLPYSLENSNIIIDLLVDTFFLTIVKNSRETKPNLEELHMVSVDDLRNCITNYENIQLQIFNKNEVKEAIKELEREEEVFLKKALKVENLEVQNDLIWCYHRVKELVLDEICDYENYKEFLKKFSLDQANISNVFGLIKQVTILMVFKNISIENIQFVKDDINNVNLEGLISYCLKSTSSSAIEDFNDAVQYLYYQLKSPNYVDSNQVIVFDAKFCTDGEPCRMELSPKLFSIGQTDANIEDFNFYKSLSYKCSRCIGIRNTDDQTTSLIEKFLDC